MATSMAGAAPGQARAGGSSGVAILSDLEGMLREMGRTGRVGPQLLGRIADLRRMASDAESRWENARNCDELFVYQAAFNIGLVLVQTERGVMAVRDGGGRPGIAPDALSMLPVMSRALEIVQSDKADPDLASDALAVAEELLDRSENAGLDTPMDEINSMIDWEKWNRMIPYVLNNLES